MKTAICLSGYFRTFELAYPNLKETIIDPFSPDIFIHTWDKLGNSFDNLENNKLDVDRILALYHPKKLLIEPQLSQLPAKAIPKINEERQYREGNFGMGSMFYSIHQANKLKQEYEEFNNFRYNVVFRCRPDGVYQGKLNLDDVKPEWIYTNYLGDHVWISDQFAYGTSTAMDRYAEVFNNIYKYQTVHPESILRRHLERDYDFQKIENFKVGLLRTSGEVQGYEEF